MAETLTIKLRNKKAKAILLNLQDLNVIKILKEDITKDWPPKKKRQAKNFLTALQQAKDAEAGKIKLKTAESLLDEL